MHDMLVSIVGDWAPILELMAFVVIAAGIFAILRKSKRDADIPLVKR